MLAAIGLGKHFGAKILFEHASFQLNAGSRYGLVGANGSGKTTLLKILSGDESPSDGSVTCGKNDRLGVLRQDRFLDDAERILDAAMRGDKEVFEAIAEYDRLSHTESPDANRVVELAEFIGQNGGYTLESRTREVLIGLGLPNSGLELPLATLSGGFKLRVLLAQVLIGRPDILLLDEPTNHLDILSIRWLELFLQNYAGCAVVISHDRRFLDAVVTRTLDVDYETVTEYAGNYSQFVVQKQETRGRKEQEIERAEKIVAEKRAFVERFGAKATKAKQAQSRLKQIDKIEIEELARSSRVAPRFDFQPRRPSGRDVLTVEALSKAYDKKQVLKDVSFQVRRKERVALIGANGIGKSTLLKALVGKLQADSGKFEWGHEAALGYFPQDHKDLLVDPALTPLSFVWDACPAEPTTYVRGQLGRMLFSGKDVEKSVSILSGGEAARVIFARLSVERPNVLILDEPTNHLDLETIDALSDALTAYEGTLLFVSHDRYFVSRIATRIIELRADGFSDFPGSYDEYLARDGADHLDVQTVVLKAKAEQRGTAAPVGPDLSREERKRRDNRRRALPKRRDELLAAIEALEGEKSTISTSLSTPAELAAPDFERLARRHVAIDEQIATLLGEWEAVETELSSLNSA